MIFTSSSSVKREEHTDLNYSTKVCCKEGEVDRISYAETSLR